MRRPEIDPERAIDLHRSMPWHQVGKVMATERGRKDRFHVEAVKKSVRIYLSAQKQEGAMKSLATQLKEFQEASEKARALADDLDELVKSVAGFERPAPTGGAGGSASGGGAGGSINMGSGGSSSTIHEPGTLDLLETQAIRISGHHARIETAIKRLGELLG